jgi:tRNA (cytidine/uridine-2'-O-)-methyltransferase
MFEVALYEPEIAPNTGNVIRLCANTGCRLHLIEPLGFDLEDSKLRRAGLDYQELTVIHCHPNYPAFRHDMAGRRIWACTTRGRRAPVEVAFQPGDVLLFGPESRGLPKSVLDALGEDSWLRIPMRPSSRSLNLSNAVAVTVYEAWRQQGYAGADLADSTGEA